MMTRKRTMAVQLLLAAILLAATTVSCQKAIREEVTEESAISFSAYASQAATKGAAPSASDILGHWVDSTSTFVRGSGIGIFAFLQKPKSNGYPVDFDTGMGEPTFMYNQKVERVCNFDGTQFWFTYYPLKFWPDEPNEQLSFFAYAPYDENKAWEDLQLVIYPKGARFTREFIIEDVVEDQTDFLWSDPVLNVTRQDVEETVNFSFHHLCAKLGFGLAVNDGSALSGNPTTWTDPNTVIRIDRITAQNVYKTFTYSISWDSENNVWTPSYEHIVGSQDVSLNYSSGLMQTPEISSSVYTTAAFRRVNDDNGWMLLAPQDGFDISVSYSVITTDSGFTSVVENTSSSHLDLSLEAGKAYMVNFIVSLEELTIAGATVESWDYDENVTEVIVPY